MLSALIVTAVLAASPGELVRADFTAGASWLSSYAHQRDHIVYANKMIDCPPAIDDPLGSIPTVPESCLPTAVAQVCTNLAAGVVLTSCTTVGTADQMPEMIMTSSGLMPRPTKEQWDKMQPWEKARYNPTEVPEWHRPRSAMSSNDLAAVGEKTVADPAPAPAVDPLIDLAQKFADADSKLSIATSAVAVAKPARDKALSDYRDELTRRGIIVPTPLPTPGPGPGPVVVGPVVSLLAVTATGNWCPGCNQLAPVIAKLPIIVLPAEDQANWTKWKVSSVPTLIMTVNGIEQTRAVGAFDQSALQDWIDKTTAWAKVHFPPPKVSDEVPPPPRRTP